MSYLSALDAELRRARVPGPQRRRILAETRDHLLEAGHDGPERFGDPAALAASFAADSASAGARAATVALVAAVLVTLALWGAIALDVRSHPWLNDFPGALAAALGVQVAAVAAFVSLARTVRHRGRPPASALPLLARTNAVAAASLALGLAVTALAEANHLVLSRAGAWELAVAAGLGRCLPAHACSSRGEHQGGVPRAGRPARPRATTSSRTSPRSGPRRSTSSRRVSPPRCAGRPRRRGSTSAVTRGASARPWRPASASRSSRWASSAASPRPPSAWSRRSRSSPASRPSDASSASAADQYCSDGWGARAQQTAR